MRSDCRPSIVGEGTAEVLGPGISSSALVLTRPTSPVMSSVSPSSMGVGTLSVAPVRSCSQFVGSVGFSLVGEWSGVSLGLGETCQSLCMGCWFGAGGSCSVGTGVVLAGGVISSGGVDVMLIEPVDERLPTDSVDVLLSTGIGTYETWL